MKKMLLLTVLTGMAVAHVRADLVEEVQTTEEVRQEGERNGENQPETEEVAEENAKDQQ